ncbi:MAG: hypothetical protein WD066_08575 [Planctomycetaceae bacterium]
MSNPMKTRLGLLVAWLLLGLSAADAQEQRGGGAFEEPPLPDKALLAKIEALPDDTWMKLPAFRTAGDVAWMNTRATSDYRRIGPSVRDYCNRMVWAADRRRALYCGAGHNIHPLNDVWEYDLASNAWICLYAPDPAPPRDSPEWYRENVVRRGDVVVTPRGGPVRPAHTWWGLCYDSDRRRLIFFDVHKGIMFTNYEQLAAAVGLKANGPILRMYGSGPGEGWVFAFDPEARAWDENVVTNTPKADESTELEYLPHRKALWLHSGKTYLMEQGAREWKPIAEQGPRSGGVSAYDAETRTIVSAGSRAFEYSCDDAEWTPGGALPEGVRGRIPHSMMCFDSVARRFVLCTTLAEGREPRRLRLFLYDLKEKAWNTPAAQGDLPTTTNFAGYYDPERNVTVVYGNREMWAYRARRK